MGEAVVSLRGLVKSYGRVRALNGLTLELPAGAVGLLGPNGAGKTTLIKLVLGLAAPDAGELAVLGLDPRQPGQRLEIRRRIGYMPEGDCLPAAMNAVEIVRTLGRLSGLAPEDAMLRAHETLDWVGVDEERYRPAGQYSSGMKQRVKLAQALVHDPPFLLLDEPTDGLDPRGRREMLELVRELGHGGGKHVLLCSHLLRDVERTCDRVVVLDRGELVREDALEAMTGAAGDTLRVRVGGALEAFERALGLHGLACEREGATRLLVRGAGPDRDALFGHAAESGARIEELEEVRTSLEDAFLELVRRRVPARAGEAVREDRASRSDRA